MQCVLGFTAGLALLPASVFAAECLPASVHFPADGPAEYFVPDADEAALRAQTHGAAPRADHVLVTHEDEGYWVPRTELDAAQVVLGTSAESFRYRGPDHCAPTDLPLDPLDAEIAPTEDSAPVAASGLQPQSGLWKLEATPVQFEGCPDVIGQNMAGGMAALPAEATTPQHLTFQTPFHPSQLRMQQYASSWRSTAPNQWVTRAMEDVFSQSPAYGGKRSYMEWTLTVHDTSRISHRSELYVVMPPEAVAAFKTDHCAAISTGHWIRVGD